MKEDLKTLVEEIEKEVGGESKISEIPVEDEGDSREIRWSVPVAEKDDVILATVVSKKEDKQMVSVINNKGMVIYTLTEDNMGVMMKRIRESVAGKVVYTTNYDAHTLHGLGNMAMVTYEFLDEKFKRSMRESSAMFKRMTRTTVSPNPLPIIIDRTLLLYYMYLVLKRNPKNINIGKYMVYVHI